MNEPKIYVDFGNADAKGRVRLNCDGTLQDLASQKIQLRSGLKLALYSDDENGNGTYDELRAIGVVEYSSDEQVWVASVNWSEIHHASEEGTDAGSAPRGPARNVG